MKRQVLSKGASIKRVFPLEKDKHYFFGYYDKSPWSRDEKNILGMRVNFLGRHSRKSDNADILLKNNLTGEIKRIAHTNAWGWQQGCMLQWLGDDFSSRILFNDLRKNKFVSVIMDIKTGKERIVQTPVYAVTPDGKRGLSLNFSRLDDVRKGYGYPGLKDKCKDEKCPERDGIYLVDLEKNKSKLIISLKDLSGYKHLDSMKNGKHWVDHIGISPDGKRFCFFYRWYINEELFHTRLFAADIDGKNLFMFPDSGFYSHFFWKNNKELFGFCSISEKFGEIRKNKKKSKIILGRILPVYRKIVPMSVRKRLLPANYFLLEDGTRKASRVNVHYEDGHGSWIRNRYLITDTYADRKHFRSLIFYDLENRKKKRLGKFYAIPDRKFIDRKFWDTYDNLGIRTDLHPRWDRRGEKICFDSVHEGSRNMYEVCVRKLID